MIIDSKGMSASREGRGACHSGGAISAHANGVGGGAIEERASDARFRAGIVSRKHADQKQKKGFTVVNPL